MTRRVKALKNSASTAVTPSHYLEARNTLGETFGTKKAQKAIRAAERNRVDVSAMAGVAGHLQDTIGKNTSTLPSTGTSSTISTFRREHYLTCIV